jgi:hypothetical protein
MASTTLNIGVGTRRGLPDCRPTPECDPRPVCPACGGLECLCRPRFFAGQLLSEEDLNRLDAYIVAKNRLHNRHLFGTGVVCGLEVVCTACDPATRGHVIVKPGYALSPCGNDIVVCRESRADVCDLINRCRPRQDDCVQPGPAAPANQNGEEEWILAICYQETPSRGITALRGNACGCGGSHGHGSGGCGCGGGSHGSARAMDGHAAGGCGCGCGGGHGGTATTAKTRATAKGGTIAAQCEPTLVCEGYRFAVYRKPQEDPRIVDPGLLIRRFLCCLEPLFVRVASLPEDSDTGVLDQWLRDHLAAIREFLVTEGLYDCDVAARLSAIPAPATSLARGNYLVAWDTTARQALAIVAAVLQKCFCAALLPPCPPPELNDCVPIATVTVTRGTCRVTQICNIGSRKFLVTWPAIQYWLSWLPFFTAWGNDGGKTPTLRDWLERVCCTPLARRVDDATLRATELRARRVPRPVGVIRRAALRAAPGAGPAAKEHPFTELLLEALRGGPEASPVSLLLAAMGAQGKGGAALASETALQYPGQAMLLHQIVAPALRSLMPAAGAAQPSAEIDRLTKAVEKLQQTVKAQQNEITNLKKRR